MRLSIDTPENVELDAEIAGFGTRCMAAAIDYVILIMLLILISLLFARAISANLRGSAVIALWIGIVFTILTFYHLIFEFLWNGQTPGKRVFGIRVVMANGLPLTTNATLIRNFVRLFDFFPVGYGVGLIVMFATKNTQRLGDIAAQTVVIRERQQLRLEHAREDYRVTYYHITARDPIPASISLEQLDETDRREIVDYLQRRIKLQRREYIVGILAARIARKMGNESAIREFISPNAAERFLEQVARAFELGSVQG